MEASKKTIDGWMITRQLMSGRVYGFCFGVTMIFFQFTVEQCLLPWRDDALECVTFFHFTNAVKNLAPVGDAQLGQLSQDFPFTHFFNLILPSLLCKY